MSRMKSEGRDSVFASGLGSLVFVLIDQRRKLLNGSTPLKRICGSRASSKRRPARRSRMQQSAIQGALRLKSRVFAAPHPAVRDNLESFARAVIGTAPYPVSHDEMIANVRTFEAISRSVASGRIETI